MKCSRNYMEALYNLYYYMYTVLESGDSVKCNNISYIVYIVLKSR